MTEFKPPKSPPYATYIPGRHPEFKVHSSLARAKSALAYQNWGTRGGVLYTWAPADGGWLPVYRVESGTAVADLPWKREAA